MMLVVVLGLRFAPGRIVSLELHSFVDGKRRNSDARQTKMIGAVVVSRTGLCIRLNCQLEILCFGFNRRVERRPLGSADFYLFRLTERGKRVIIQIKGNLARWNCRMFSKIF